MADKDSQDEKYCSNCKKDIAAVNFIMHEMHCKRHIVLCKKCNEPVPRSEEEEHFNTYHVEVNCDLCKMKIEKDQLESHMVIDCPNKPSQCSYCELEIPQCDVSEHEGYCGTRTEPCLSCEQYIMIKDLNRHVESACRYPTPKPPLPSIPQTTPNPYEDSIDPYTFDEIHRILDEAMVPSSILAGSGIRFQIPPMHSVRNNTTDRSRGKNTTNSRSTVNKQNELRSTSPNGRYDSMLSQMLTRSLSGATGSNDEINQYMMEVLHKENEIAPNTLTSSGSSSTSPNYNNDEIMLPCEFCGDLIPSYNIIQHQSGCDPLTSGSWVTTEPHTDNQNNVIQPQTHRSSAFIPVINNLETNRLPQWQSNDIEADTADIDNDYNVFINDNFDDDQVMLPCEFCSELFPSEMLVLHQSVCDLNTTVTPRVMTPATQYQPKLKPSEHKPRNYTTDDSFNKSRMMRRLPAPSLENHQENSNDSDTFPLYNRRDMPNTAATNFNLPDDNRRINGLTSRVRKSSRHTESKTKDTLDKLLQDQDSSRETKKDVVSNKANGASSRVLKSYKHSDSEILNKLFEQDIDDSLRESRKTFLDSNKMNGAIGGSADINVRKKKPLHISSKTVVQELDKNDRERSRGTRQKQRSPKGLNNGENIPAVSSRQRSVHLLNADSNTRTQPASQSQFSTRTRTNLQQKSKKRSTPNR